MRWVAIWQDGWPLLPQATDVDITRPIAEMTLALELILPPLPRRQALRLWQGAGGETQAIGLYAMPDGSVRLTHGDIDVSTPRDFIRVGETLCLRYRACARGRHDTIAFENADREIKSRLRAAVAQPMTLADALPRDPRFLKTCHIAAVAPFGVAPTDFAGFVQGTPIQTPGGAVRVEHLSEGDLVTTADGDAVPVRWCDARPRLCLGRTAPVRLRAPYFGLTHDVIVTPETRLLRTGPTVDYIFGTDVVLAYARDLAHGKAAIRDRQRAVRNFYHLMLDDHACLMIDRCAIETALLADVVAAEDMAPRPNLAEADTCHVVPILDRASAQALVTAGTKGRRAIG